MNLLKKRLNIVTSRRLSWIMRTLIPGSRAVFLSRKTLGFPSHPYGWFGFLQV